MLLQKFIAVCRNLVTMYFMYYMYQSYFFTAINAQV